MKIKVEKYTRNVEEIEVDLPYYFEDRDSADDDQREKTFGKVDKSRTITITARKAYSFYVNDEYNLCVRDCNASEYAKYLNGDFQSTKEEFNHAIDEMICELGKMRGENENT